ncbi:MAG: hypothetical protein JST75_20450 [Bacteroidetes bacterium]|nr:hypothetical protein [Bacteroidota bacterium]
MFFKTEIKIDADEFRDFIIKQLEGIENVELFILKGHILIEYALNKYIDSFSQHDESFEDARFGFASKIQICKILGLFFGNVNDNLERQLLIINKIRNQIAHTLDFEERLLLDLYNLSAGEIDELAKYSKQDKGLVMLHDIIPWICGNIMGRLKLFRQKSWKES